MNVWSILHSWVCLQKIERVTTAITLSQSHPLEPSVLGQNKMDWEPLWPREQCYSISGSSPWHSLPQWDSLGLRHSCLSEPHDELAMMKRPSTDNTAIFRCWIRNFNLRLGLYVMNYVAIYCLCINIFYRICKIKANRRVLKSLLKAWLCIISFYLCKLPFSL